MAEPEFTATDVRIDTGARSLTRAGRIRISGGGPGLPTGQGSEIAGAPVRPTRVSSPFLAPRGRASAVLGGRRHLLTLGENDPAPGVPGSPAARPFRRAVHGAAGRTG
ncbi:hypothetical protein C3489_22530 [Streptomyces sp. Ru71]|uniref:hypothetical protein n=1 Tax=Streptomyces sp. Ru71 TaxID=2080746 RepID=UPI000CDE1C3B|nr:hypothetical protein [Streptomyces sp. Ru71]POX50426.1 hypothetical protein C3489_22530 [Streptomyces sp. Ru71]